MKKFALVSAAIALFAWSAVHGQEATIAPPEGIVADGVPAVSLALVDTVARYAEYRSAFVTSWHPQRREMIIGTRFGNTYQAHMVKTVAGARQQLTFFTEPVSRVGRSRRSEGNQIGFSVERQGCGGGR
jgi:hypothetical protein